MIINLTQHISTPEQGCIEPKDKSAVQALLTMDTLPTEAEILDRAMQLAQIAALEHGAEEAMIGGAPWLMGPLERALVALGTRPVYAFSVRHSVDQLQPDGSVKKVQVFRHAGFIPAVLT